jgi:hypothetical protein
LAAASLEIYPSERLADPSSENAFKMGSPVFALGSRSVKSTLFVLVSLLTGWENTQSA